MVNREYICDKILTKYSVCQVNIVSKVWKWVANSKDVYKI